MRARSMIRNSIARVRRSAVGTWWLVIMRIVHMSGSIGRVWASRRSRRERGFAIFARRSWGSRGDHIDLAFLCVLLLGPAFQGCDISNFMQVLGIADIPSQILFMVNGRVTIVSPRRDKNYVMARNQGYLTQIEKAYTLTMHLNPVLGMAFYIHDSRYCIPVLTVEEGS